jgi:hypothetical protein
MTTVKVTGEIYRTYPTGRQWINATAGREGVAYVPCTAAPFVNHEKMEEALKAAFVIAGTLGCDVIVDRVTLHEKPDEQTLLADIFGTNDRTETVTGTYRVHFPHFTEPNLSRYHPNNGWVVPATLDI